MMSKDLSNSSLYILQIVITNVLALSLIGIMTHKLTPTELGEFFLVQIYTNFAVGVANLGLLVGYERNFFIYEKSRRQSAELISSAQSFVFLNLLILTLIVYAFQAELSLFITSTEKSNNLLIILLVASSISSLSQYYLTYFKNSSLVKSYVKFTIFQVAIYFCFAIFLLFTTSLKVMSLAYAMLISQLLTFILLFFTVSKSIKPSFNRLMLKEVFKISFPLTPRVFFGVLNTQFDKIMLGLIGLTESVGIYSVGQKISYFIFQFMTALGKVFQPEVYRKLFANKQNTHEEEIDNYIFPFFYFSILVALLVILFSQEFVYIIFPNEYSSAALIIIILSLYYAALFFGKITGNQLIYAKKTHLTSLLMLVGIIINAAFNIPFILKWGMTGAAWATTIAGILMGFIGYFVAQRYAKIIWQWKKFWMIYLVLLLGAVFNLIDYGDLLPTSYYSTLIINLLILFIYIVIGFKLNILNEFKIGKFIQLVKMRNF